MRKFRFQDLKIWQEAMKITDGLLDIAEGSGSSSDKNFAHFLNIARRSTFENANMIILFHRRNLISLAVKESIFDSLDELCRKITNFQKTLLNLKSRD